MPGLDGMGPMGMGPMTGRAAGCCARAGDATPRPGWGCGRGMGWGRGFAWRARGVSPAFDGSPQAFSADRPGDAWQTSREEELAHLKRQTGMLKDALDAINGRIRDMESKDPSGEGEKK